MAEGFAPSRFARDRQPEQKQVKPGRGLVIALNFVTGSHVRAVAFLIIWSLLLYLPGFFTIPPVDREESRSAQATRQMVETGDFVNLRYQDEVIYRRPVAIHWLQAATVEVASRLGLQRAQVRIWLYRIPSLIGAIGAVLLTYWAALTFVTRRGSVLAALLMCSATLLGVEARIANADTMTLLSLVAAMGALSRVYLGWQRGEDVAHPSWAWPSIFWTAMVAGILFKGPVVPIVTGLTIIVLVGYDRTAEWLWRLRPVWGLSWLVLLLLPWVVAMVWFSGEPTFKQGGALTIGQTIARWLPNAPPGANFGLFWLGFWPGAPIAAMAVPAIWRARREPAALFLLAWVVPSWIAFELFLPRLPSYSLLLYPAIAILTAGALELRVLSRSWLARSAAWWFAIPAILSVMAVIAAITLTRQPVFLAWPFAGVALILGLLAWWMFDDNHAERSLLNGAAAALFLSFAIYGFVVSAMTRVFPSPEVARILRNAGCASPIIAAAGYHEPSVVFMTNTSTLLTDGSGAADFLSQGACRFAVVESRSERAFAQRAQLTGLRYTIAGRVDGYNFSQGKTITIAIFKSEGQ